MEKLAQSSGGEGLQWWSLGKGVAAGNLEGGCLSVVGAWVQESEGKGVLVTGEGRPDGVMGAGVEE